jgi:hypothetical protein
MARTFGSSAFNIAVPFDGSAAMSLPFSAAMASTTAKCTDVIGPDVGHHPDAGLHEVEWSLQGNSLATYRRGDLQHAEFVTGFDAEDRVGEVMDSVVAAGALVALELGREDGCNELLGGRFATAAGNSNEDHPAQLRPIERRQPDSDPSIDDGDTPLRRAPDLLQKPPTFRGIHDTG